MGKKAAKFKAPDVEKDRALLRKDLEKYVEDLKSGAIVPEDISPDDERFQSLFRSNHSDLN